jgi:uncharacterized protein YqgC (DUF456 family)
MVYLWASLYVLMNVAWLGLSLLSLPGNWLMIICAFLLDWATADDMFSLWTLGAALVIALIGEIIEFIAGARGAAKAGGTRWGAVGAIVGGITGAIVGSAILLVIGTLIGAAIGAFAGATLFEMMGGKRRPDAMKAGQGAAVGQVTGMITKFGLGCIIFLILGIAAFA